MSRYDINQQPLLEGYSTLDLRDPVNQPCCVVCRRDLSILVGHGWVCQECTPAAVVGRLVGQLSLLVL